MIILAVESSCDETSVAVVKDGKEVLSNVVNSQIDIHKKFGGVVPEIASRNHIINMTYVFKEAIKKANITHDDIDLVAVTHGPGLIGSLLVGINAASAYALSYDKPLIGIHHLKGHIYAANIDNDLKFPLIALLVSGGHTELIYMEDHGKYEILGETLDDAVGEAYDKVARMLDLGYPGGPIIDALAEKGKDTYNLTRPYLDKDEYMFSFSGIKSAVNNIIYHANRKGEEINKANLACSFQEAVIDVLIYKLKLAVKNYNVDNIVIAGGVAANKRLRQRVFKEIEGKNIIIPKMEYCTDNAAMIGAAAYYEYKKRGASKDYLIKGSSQLDL
ncbi:MAG: tRNA (adenosine(37)-N6)-threonylcarbamoyltransferase complex transferase subunit TsaD [Acholeplasmataceae bacterium]|jgi:N6-L-threonylcarbamoyladenine synthase|nr:tRNA (adenosine(37)-N6)-threonylcarbamoyltransferase complex transferase subunit TsaD [Acholeplasmataceae bacterium]